MIEEEVIEEINRHICESEFYFAGIVDVDKAPKPESEILRLFSNGDIVIFRVPYKTKDKRTEYANLEAFIEVRRGCRIVHYIGDNYEVFCENKSEEEERRAVGL